MQSNNKTRTMSAREEGIRAAAITQAARAYSASPGDTFTALVGALMLQAGQCRAPGEMLDIAIDALKAMQRAYAVAACPTGASS